MGNRKAGFWREYGKDATMKGQKRGKILQGCS